MKYPSILLSVISLKSKVILNIISFEQILTN